MDQPFSGPAAGGSAGGSEQKVDVFGKRPSSRSMTRYIKPTLWGLAILYVVLLLLANRGKTEVNFLFFTAEAPLVVALVVVFLLGVVVGVGGVFMRDRRKTARVAKSKGK